MEKSNYEVKVAVLEERIDNFEKVFSRLDDAISKIAEVNSTVSRMLSVHEERLDHQEKDDEILFKKIDDLRILMHKDHEGVLQRIQNLETKLWGVLGGITVIGFLTTGGLDLIIKMLQPPAIRDTIEEVRPSSLELHRHEIYQSSFGSTEQIL